MMLRYANHDKARLEARHLMSSIGIKQLPINIHSVIKKMKICLLPYSEDAEQFSKVIELLRKKKCEAIISQDPKDMTYYIRYDDGSHIHPDRLRFTLAHEIGHVCLKHLEEFGHSCARHGGIINKNHPSEREADSFAGEFLRPSALLTLLNVDDVFDIEKICDVSYQSACIAARQIEILKKCRFKNEYQNDFNFYMNQFYNFINHKYCTNCLYHFINPAANYCPICGEKNLNWLNPRLPMYSFLKNEKGELPTMIYANIQVVQCFNCNNEEIDPNAMYCKICGSYILNKCSDPGCNVRADSNARFCIRCGKPTVFSQLKYFDDWRKEKEKNFFDDISF